MLVFSVCCFAVSIFRYDIPYFVVIYLKSIFNELFVLSLIVVAFRVDFDYQPNYF